MHPYLVLLHQAEYHQLLRKGQLQALPASRFLSPATDPELAIWLTEHPAPLAQPTAWLLLPAASATMPLAIEQTAFDAPLPLDPAAVEQLLAQPLPSAVPQSWLQKLLEIVKQGSWLQEKLPHGMVIVARHGGRPEQQPTIPVTLAQYLRPQDLAHPERWEHALPDVADEDGAVLLPLRQPFGQPLTKDHLTGEVFALTERGRSLLVGQANYPASISARYQKYIQPVLDKRRAADQQATARRVASLVPLPSAGRKNASILLEQLLSAFASRSQQSVGALPSSFWDAMLAYERTGEGAEAVPPTSRGYLVDLGSVVKKYLQARKARGEFDEATSTHIRELLHQWGQLMNDPRLDANAGAVFVPKNPAAPLVQHLNQLLQPVGINALAVAYLYFYLRDTIGNKEQDLTTELLQELLFGAKSAKLESELFLALYAIGLLEPNHRFLPVLRSSLDVAATTAEATAPAQTSGDPSNPPAKASRASASKANAPKAARSSTGSRKSKTSTVTEGPELPLNGHNTIPPVTDSSEDSINLASITQ